MRYLWRAVVGANLVLALGAGQASALDPSEEDYELKLLGQYVFFDKISTPARMACATCHDPKTGGTGFVAGMNQHQVAITGADPHTVGGLRPPSNAYASLVPTFQECQLGGIGFSGIRYCGGNFWNGRAEGRDALLPGATEHVGAEVFQASSDPQVLGYAKYFGPTTDQAINPMPNPVEQNIDRKSVCEQVSGAAYASLYEAAWGEVLDCADTFADVTISDETEFDISFKRLMLAVGAFQHSSEVNSFSSKRDNALRAELACAAGDANADPAVCTHADFLNSPGAFPLVGFTAQENAGHDLFYGAANCAICHLSERSQPDGTGLLERYSDDAYHNIGTPMNPELPADPDPGLSAHVGVEGPRGIVRTPTLRNVDKRPGVGFTKAYSHNGWFKSLETLVHFYNTARAKPRCAEALTAREALAEDCWPAPEWEETIPPPFLVGDLQLSADEEAALVAYLRTLTDAYTTKEPPPYH